jgi:hypothetical protein
MQDGYTAWIFLMAMQIGYAPYAGWLVCLCSLVLLAMMDGNAACLCCFIGCLCWLPLLAWNYVLYAGRLDMLAGYAGYSS